MHRPGRRDVLRGLAGALCCAVVARPAVAGETRIDALIEKAAPLRGRKAQFDTFSVLTRGENSVAPQPFSFAEAMMAA